VSIISACGGEDENVSSNTPTVISVPTGVLASPGDGSNLISWNAVSDATSYNIYWSTSSAVSKNNGTKITGSNSPYTHAGLVNGTRYYYVVTAVNATGESADSSIVSAVPFGVPDGVSATSRDSHNVISWAPVPNAISYNLYWSTSTGVNKINGTKINLGSNPQTHTGLTNGTTYYYVVTALSTSVESSESAEVSATPVAADVVEDPLYADQWHLNNTGQLAGVVGEDVNVEPAWASYKGIGVRIAVVDDGLEIGHEDLATNIAATGLSYNYVTFSSDPTNDLSDITSGHGTSVAGIAASRDLNGLGGRGVAPRANLVGYNLLQNTTLSNEADAMTRGSANVHISSNSWGPPDDGDLKASSSTWRTAINTGLSIGRNGLGTIYTWAAGNGGDVMWGPPDNSNYDGQANYYGVIAVAAVNDQGKRSSYSESGANLWISAPGGEYCDTHTISTTDRTGSVGSNPFNSSYGYADYADQNYTKCMNGTSAATPAASGVIALLLEANPNLGWRDVRLILAQSARKNDAADAGWVTTGGSQVYNFNHKYGFGVVDAGAAVALASGWVNVGAQKTFTTLPSSPNSPIPDSPAAGVPGSAIDDIISVTGSAIANIEYIEITFSAADHTYSADLEITLTSPAGTTSQLSEAHGCPQDVCTPHSGWVFGSARHLGEAVDGNWTLTVRDGGPFDTGTFQSWKLKFYGR
jgi:kexin